MTLPLSIIMSVYNDEKHLNNAIRSIRNQTYADFEFIAVNDASTDNSLEILHHHQEKDPRIRIYNNYKNVGLTKSLNTALKLANGKFIARQDADDLSRPDRLTKQLQYFEEHQNVVLLGTAGYLIDEEGRTLAYDSVLNGSGKLKKKLLVKNQFMHGSVMIRRCELLEIGGYRQEFKYAQDYDLFLRISEKYDIDNLPEPLYFYRIKPEAISVIRSRQQQICAFVALAASKERKAGKLANWDAAIFAAYEKKVTSGRYLKRIDCNLSLTKGRNSMLSGDRQQARKDFIAAFRIKPSPQTLYHLVRSYVTKK